MAITVGSDDRADLADQQGLKGLEDNADIPNNTLRVMDLGTGEISSFSGAPNRHLVSSAERAVDGFAEKAKFACPWTWYTLTALSTWWTHGLTIRKVSIDFFGRLLKPGVMNFPAVPFAGILNGTRSIPAQPAKPNLEIIDFAERILGFRGVVGAPEIAK